MLLLLLFRGSDRILSFGKGDLLLAEFSGRGPLFDAVVIRLRNQPLVGLQFLHENE